MGCPESTRARKRTSYREATGWCGSSSTWWRCAARVRSSTVRIGTPLCRVRRAMSARKPDSATNTTTTTTTTTKSITITTTTATTTTTTTTINTINMITTTTITIDKADVML